MQPPLSGFLKVISHPFNIHGEENVEPVTFQSYFDKWVFSSFDWDFSISFVEGADWSFVADIGGNPFKKTTWASRKLQSSPSLSSSCTGLLIYLFWGQCLLHTAQLGSIWKHFMDRFSFKWWVDCRLQWRIAASKPAFNQPIPSLEAIYLVIFALGKHRHRPCSHSPEQITSHSFNHS